MIFSLFFYWLKFHNFFSFDFFISFFRFHEAFHKLRNASNFFFAFMKWNQAKASLNWKKFIIEMFTPIVERYAIYIFVSLKI